MKRPQAMLFAVMIAGITFGLWASITKALDFCFDPPASYAPGSYNNSITAADFDADGDIDLAATLVGDPDDSLLILLNDGDGTFAAPAFYKVGAGPYAGASHVVSEDLDGDGDVDLAVAAYFLGASVLTNNGDGTFTAATDYPAGTVVWSLSAGDLDADADVDLIVCNNGSDDVSVLKNNGNATFATAVNYAVGDGPFSVAASDLDGDGDLDLAVANGLDGDMTILRNNGTGAFVAAGNHLAGSFPSSIASADLDGDGDQDLVTANYSGNDVSVLENIGGGGMFAVAVNYPTGTNPNSVRIADLDGDGYLDLAVACLTSGTVSVLKGNGSGAFAPAESYPAGLGAQSIAVADLDRNGGLDMAAATYDDHDVSVLMNCGTGAQNVVSTIANSGTGSLRAAIAFANANPGPDTISFSVAGTIQPLTQLPPLSDINGGLVIDGFTAPGAVSPTSPTVVLDGSLTATGSGLKILSSNNSISGLEIRGFDGRGIAVEGKTAARNTIRQNLIHSNTGLGIDLGAVGVAANDPGDGDSGPNSLVNYPVIDAIQVTEPVGDSVFTIEGTAAKKSVVELYLAERYLGGDTIQHPSGHGDAWQYIGSALADAATGRWVSAPVNCRAQSYISATATDTMGNTSELATNWLLVPDSLIVTAYSPVDIIVLNPSGADSIGPGFNTFGNRAMYDSLTDYGMGANGIPGEFDDRVVILAPEVGQYIVKIVPEFGGSGDYYLGVTGVRDPGGDISAGGYVNMLGAGGPTVSDSPVANPVPPPEETVSVPVIVAAQRRGDLNADGEYDIVDVVAVVGVAFRASVPPSPESLADVNSDGVVADILDVVRIVGAVFRNEPKPGP